MAGLVVPAIQSLLRAKAWMPGTSTGMTQAVMAIFILRSRPLGQFRDEGVVHQGRVALVHASFWGPCSTLIRAAMMDRLASESSDTIGARDTAPESRGAPTLGMLVALFCALLAFTALPVLLHPWPPMSDYINHLARMQVIATVNTDPDLARFYEIDWQILPNLMEDLIVPPLTRLMSIYAAGQTYTILSFVLIAAGTIALHRALFHRWSALPLIAFPFLYNNVFLVGTMNYVFGIGLALWALATWAWLRERSLPLRLLVSMLFVIGLFFCHLFAVGVYGIGLLAFELNRLWSGLAHRGAGTTRGGALRPLIDFAVSGLPFVPVLPLLMESPTWGLRQTYTWELPGKLEGLSYIIEVYSHGAAFFFTAAIAFAIGWVIRDRALRFHALGVWLLAIGFIV